MASKILLIGAASYIGKFMVESSVKVRHLTFLFVQEATLANPAKSPIIQKFKSLGVNIVFGDLYDHQSLVKAIKQVDVVISTVGHTQLDDQYRIVSAIKEAGNVKRFLPSELGTMWTEVMDRSHAVEPAKSAFATNRFGYIYVLVVLCCAGQ